MLTVIVMTMTKTTKITLSLVSLLPYFSDNRYAVVLFFVILVFCCTIFNDDENDNGDDDDHDADDDTAGANENDHACWEQYLSVPS